MDDNEKSIFPPLPEDTPQKKDVDMLLPESELLSDVDIVIPIPSISRVYGNYAPEKYDILHDQEIKIGKVRVREGIRVDVIFDDGSALRSLRGDITLIARDKNRATKKYVIVIDHQTVVSDYLIDSIRIIDPNSGK